MTKRTIFIIIALVVAALLFVAKKPDQALDGLLPEVSAPVAAMVQGSESHSEADGPTGASSETPDGESNVRADVTEIPETSEREYVPGYFAAPEHLQTAVYRAISEPRSSFTGFVEDMKCVSGNCSIFIRVTAAKGLMIKAADLMASINAQFEESSLTEDIIVGVVSVRPDDNGEGLIEFVTMDKPVMEGGEQD